MEESQPAYLQGRGRGRGVGRGNVADNNRFGRNVRQGKAAGSRHNSSESDSTASNSPHNPSSPVKKAWNKQEGSVNRTSAESRFEDAAAKHKESSQKHLDEDMYESSDEEEQLNDHDILKTMLKTFQGSVHGNGDSDLGRTQEYITNTVKSKASVCLICIATIKRNDPIWGCQGCYTSFHINCVQKWVKDGVYQQASFEDDNSSQKTILWNCPKCRYNYKQHECPTRYFCFCGKEEDPEFDPWLVPHSCGQMCGKKLRPECGHSCLLLCHPGPCPPCPQTVRITCYCGSKDPQIRRCGAKEWSCSQPCKSSLSCGHHRCQSLCHSGDCPACPYTSLQPCQCGMEQTERPCATPVWQCDRVCNKALECGHHTCEMTCHAGDCGKCPRSGKRSCPCGKTLLELPCTEDVPTCLETCEKILECGRHQCGQRCHTGPCGTCREMTVKTCRCGKKKKELQCFKEYLCETKCVNMKDCRKHPCKRKCCDNDCPPCELMCIKSLGCRNHKCSSRCHRGPCYPCPETVTILCNCGATSVTVPCGREKVTKPPKCKQKCSKAPDCHHSASTPHRCHRGRCPQCDQVCNKTLKRCNHVCYARCHTAVFTKIKEKVERSGPWEAAPEVREEQVDFKCPPCRVPVPVSCLGKHETIKMPCAISRVASCGRPCGKTLLCGNHICTLECHTVKEAPDDQTAGSNCLKCEEACNQTRPEGCAHQCLLSCHSDECPACEQMIRMRCHCQMVLQHVQCDQWTHADDTERDRLKSCGCQCPKVLSCGHGCKLICHPGPCPKPDRCVEKVRVKCSCKRKKAEFLCNEVYIGDAKVLCDEVCEEIIQQKKKDKDEQEKQRKQDEEQKQQQEYEAFQNRLQGKKRKKRKPRQEEEEPTFLQKYGKFVIAPTLILLMAVFIYYLIENSRS